VSDAFFDKFIADLVKGASHHLRENGGVGVNIVVSRENHGREEKLAFDASALMRSPLGGAALGAGVGGLASLVSGDEHPLRDAVIGAGVGGLHGNLSSQLHGIDTVARDTAALAQPAAAEALSRMDYNLWPKAQKLIYGHAGKYGALTDHYTAGAEAALGALGIKVAFLPMLGAIAGPTLARAGLGALGRGVAGKALGGIAGKVAPRIAGGLGGAAFDQAASMAGGALGQKMQQPPQPQGMMG